MFFWNREIYRLRVLEPPSPRWRCHQNGSFLEVPGEALPVPFSWLPGFDVALGAPWLVAAPRWSSSSSHGFCSVCFYLCASPLAVHAAWNVLVHPFHLICYPTSLCLDSSCSTLLFSASFASFQYSPYKARDLFWPHPLACGILVLPIGDRTIACCIGNLKS